jgi:WD40 repeat protein
MAELFISYSRRDQAFVRRLAAGLEDRGKDVWVDLDDILPSAPWMAEIKVAIAEADSVVVVLSPDSVASEVCGNELQHAIDLNKRLIPVVARPVPIEDVSPALASLNFLDFSADSSDAAFEVGLARLVTVLDTDLNAVHLHTRLLIRTAEWEDSGQDSARLLRGRQLAEAERWMEAQGQRTPAPTAGQTALIMASRRAAIRRQRGSMAVAGVVALGLIGLSVFSLVQWHAAVVQRGQANSRAEAAEAQDELTSDPTRALNLALQGFHSADTTQAQTALRNAVHTSALRAILPPTKQAVRAEAQSADGGGGLGQVAVDPSGTYVAVTNTSGDVEVWRWRARSGPGSYSDPYRLLATGAEQAEFIDNGRRLLVVEEDGTLLEWNWRTAGKAAVLRRGLQNPVASQNGELLATFSFTGTTVSVAGATTGDPVSTISTGPVIGTAFSPDGSLLATWDGDGSGSIAVWLVSDGRLIENVGVAPETLANTGEVPVAISPGDDRIVVAGSNEISVYSLGAPNAAPKVLTMTAPSGATAEGGGTYTAGSLAWSPNGEELVAGGHDEALRVWSGNLGGQTFLGPVGGGAGGVAFTPDGSDVISGGPEETATVWSWASVTQESLSVPTGVASGATISPDGRVVAYAADPSSGGLNAQEPVYLWDVSTFRTYPLTSADGISGVDLAFSPNGRWLAVASEGIVSVWDVATRSRLSSLALSGQDPQLSDLTFDSSGRILTGVRSTTSGDSTSPPVALVEWRWGSRAPASVLEGLRQSSLGDVAIANVASDGTIRFVYRRDYLTWDGSTSVRDRVLRKDAVPTGRVTGATFTDGGTEMVFQVLPLAHPKTVEADLTTGRVRTVLGQFAMQPAYVTSPDGRLVGGTERNGSAIVWDENPSDAPVAIPTSDPVSTVTLAGPDLLISQPGDTGLFVLPDAYCGQLNAVVSLAQSILVHPTALAESFSYND